MTQQHHADDLHPNTDPTAEPLRQITLAECYRALRETGQTQCLEAKKPTLRAVPVEQTLETQFPPEVLAELRRLESHDAEQEARARLFDVVAEVMTPPNPLSTPHPAELVQTHENTRRFSVESLPMHLRLLVMGLALLATLLAVALFLGRP